MSRLGWAGLVLLLLVAAASVSFSGGRTFELVDERGASIEPVYIAYAYAGHRLNPVHPVTYQARPIALIRSDGSGRIAVPSAVHVHRPFPFETHPSLWVELIYAPSRHNGWGQLNPGSPSLPGIFEIGEEGRRATIANLADRPEQWEGTLRNLASLLNRLVSRPSGSVSLRELDPETATLARELIGHFRQEYDAFLTRYRDVERARPEMPGHVRLSSADEQRRWAEEIDKMIALEPRWGQIFERLFRDEVRLFNQWLAE